MIDQPRITNGRMVCFMDGDLVCLAMITDEGDRAEMQTLTVFLPSFDTRTVKAVYSATPTPGTWHIPTDTQSVLIAEQAYSLYHGEPWHVRLGAGVAGCLFFGLSWLFGPGKRGKPS